MTSNGVKSENFYDGVNGKVFGVENKSGKCVRDVLGFCVVYVW